MLVSLPKADRARVLTLDGGGYLVPPDVNARLRADSRFALAAYHGTPHEVSGGFSTKRIGTGEGAQVYGWGLYFAENVEVAEEYRKNLSRSAPDIHYDGFRLQPFQTIVGSLFRFVTGRFDAWLI